MHFNQMLDALDANIVYRIAEFPSAFDMFLPENRDKYDVLVFYHMWQQITDDQAKMLSECIKARKTSGSSASQHLCFRRLA